MQHIIITDGDTTVSALVKILRSSGEEILIEEKGEAVAKIIKYENSFKGNRVGALKTR